MTINKKLSLILGIIIIIIAATTAIIENVQSHQSYTTTTDNIGITSTNSANTNTTDTKTVSQNTGTTSTAKTPDTYTLADVAKHNNGNSCWTAINGNVYDVTTWINQHPGGSAAILSLCGIDGSAAFNGQHGGQRRPAEELATFKIGTLTQ